MKHVVLMVAAPAVAWFAMSFWYAPRQADAQSTTRGAKQAHYDTLWNWLQRAGYTSWTGLDGTPPDFQEGQSPHGALIKVYLSPRTAANPNDPPIGSVIVKENYNPDGKLMAITAMHRSPGYDPRHGDWYYAKYMPDGTIATTPPEMKSMPIAGRFKMCVECHSGAGGDDFAFFND